MKRVLFLVMLAVLPALSQNNVFDLRPFEWNDQGTVTYRNFIYSHFFAQGKVIAEAVHTRIPPAGYKEFAVGAGYAVMNSSALRTYLIGHISSATDDNYFEPALLALLNRGKVSGSFFLMYYMPLGDQGIHQILVDPIEVQYNVAGPISLGLCSYYYRPEVGNTVQKNGGKVSYAFRYGALELAVRKVNMGGGTEFQLRTLVMF